MPLPYQARTDDYCKNINLVPEGDYAFQVFDVILTRTQGGLDKNGKEKPIENMLELYFDFWTPSGILRKQRDWIILSSQWDWKLRRLAESLGLTTLYDSNALEGKDMLGKKGVFHLGVKDFKQKDTNNTLPGNFVKSYIKQGDIFLVPPIPVTNVANDSHANLAQNHANLAHNTASNLAPDFNGDIPF